MKKPDLYNLTWIILLLLLIANPLYAQKDTIPPVLTLIGADSLFLGVNEKYTDPGITITDNRDTITSWDTSGSFYNIFPDGKVTMLGTYVITYFVKDKSNNSSSISRMITVGDTIAPEIKLIVDTVICLQVGDFYQDSIKRFEIKDNYDAESDITIMRHTCRIDSTDRPGIWPLRYRAVDRSGNVSYSPWWYLIVKVKGDTSPCILKDSVNDSCRFYHTATIKNQPEFNNENIKVYPNPTSGKVTITLNPGLKENYTIRLLDVSGRCLLNRNEIINAASIQTEFDVSALKEGIYFVEINGTATRYIKKLVVIR